MRSVKPFLAGCVGLLAAFPPAGALAGPPNCEPPEIGASRALLVSPPLGAVVVGKGRLQFHSAPDARCPMMGTFIIPKDAVVMYAQSPDFGWSLVAYVGPDFALQPEGWVRTARLKVTGEMGHGY